MNAHDLKKNVAVKAVSTINRTDDTLAALAAVMTEAMMSGEDITLPGIGKFSVARRDARVGRNPRTGETVHIAAKNAVTFKACAALKAAINNQA